MYSKKIASGFNVKELLEKDVLNLLRNFKITLNSCYEQFVGSDVVEAQSFWALLVDLEKMEDALRFILPTLDRLTLSLKLQRPELISKIESQKQRILRLADDMNTLNMLYGKETDKLLRENLSLCEEDEKFRTLGTALLDELNEMKFEETYNALNGFINRLVP